MRALRFSALTGVFVLGIGAACAQSYPSKPVRILAAEAGGGNDLTARLIAQNVAGPLGQPVIIDNRGSTFLGPLGAKAPPDGYTLIIAGSTFMLQPLLEKTVYDPIKDFAPITIATKAPNVLIVHPSLPVKSVKELIALAKARPGDLNYASGGIGSAAHLAAELFNSLARVNIVRINYRGNGPAINDLIAGHVQLMIATPGSVTAHVKSGRLRALAVTTSEPSRLFPGMPTIAAAVPGYELTQKTGLLVPAGTPAAVITRLNQEIVRVVNQQDFKDKMFALGVDAGGSTPEEFANMIKTDIARMGRIIKDAGIKND